MSDYTPPTDEVFAAWEATLWEGIAGPLSMRDADWDGDRMRAQLARWLDAERARIWREGFDACADYMEGPDWARAPGNPYRTGGHS